MSLVLVDVVTLLARAGDAPRDVGGHQQLRRIDALLGDRRDADARAKHRRAAFVGDGPIERAQDLHRREHRLRRVREARQHDADLVVAEGGHAVVGAKTGRRRSRTSEIVVAAAGP